MRLSTHDQASRQLRRLRTRLEVVEQTIADARTELPSASSPARALRLRETIGLRGAERTSLTTLIGEAERWIATHPTHP